ncbi:site-specific integrase [Streptomyces goshikiensis]|uniref:site-specific integrase n=1 Tax=Streptomyces goshikiensis TaxID=1942 RepID=UPI00367E63C3
MTDQTGRWPRLRPVHDDQWPRHSFRTCKACRDVTPHVLRASRITHMLDDAVPLAEVQAFADHDNPATTVGYWTRRNTAVRNAELVDAGATIFAGRPRPSLTEATR